MRLHIFGDQKRDATGVFYEAFGRAIATACAARAGTQLGVHYTYLDLGKIEHHPHKAASAVAAKARQDDRVVIVWDIEDRDPALTQRQLRELLSALADRGLGAARVRCVLVRPLTEAVYLLDEPMLGALLAWKQRQRRQDRLPDGRRPRRAVADSAELRALAMRRRAHARSPGAQPLPQKSEMLRILDIADRDKAALASWIAQRLRLNYTLPERGEIAELDRLVDWLVESLR